MKYAIAYVLFLALTSYFLWSSLFLDRPGPGIIETKAKNAKIFQLKPAVTNNGLLKTNERKIIAAAIDHFMSNHDFELLYLDNHSVDTISTDSLRGDDIDLRIDFGIDYRQYPEAIVKFKIDNTIEREIPYRIQLVDRQRVTENLNPLLSFSSPVFAKTNTQAF